MIEFLYILGIVLIYIFFLIKPVNTPLELNEIIKILTRQAARWTTAAQQDNNLLIAVLHANYGAGYLWALKDIATDQQIYNATGIDIQTFTKMIVSTQDKTTQNLAKTCPKYPPPKTYLTSIGGENI